MSNSLAGKIAVVTGGNSGIGYATAEEFLKQGAKVVITGRNAEKVEKAAQKLGVEGIVADQSNLSHLDSLVEKVKELHGKVDILFVNAGVFFPTPLGQISEELYEIQMNINLKGAIFTLQKFLPILNEGASVINLSSINAYTGSAGTAIYAATKAALNSFTRTAAGELASQNIRVNAVNPGLTETPIFEKVGMNEEQIAGFKASMVSNIPLKRIGTSEGVAKLVTFLASDDASYITGAEYTIDGGMTLIGA